MKGLVVSCISFMSANYIYQWFQVTPDYMLAFDRTRFQFVIVLFILFKIRNGFKP